MTKNSRKKDTALLSKILIMGGVFVFVIGSCISIIAGTLLFNENKKMNSNKKDYSTDNYNTIKPLIYPVGSIYITATDDTVAKVEARFGGTWVAFGTGQTLVGVKSDDTDFATVEKSGGSKTQDYTPAGTNSGAAVTFNAVSLSHSGGAVTGTKLTAAQMGQKNLGTLTTAGNNRGHTHVYSRSNDNTNATTLTADQTGLRSHGHSISVNFSFTVGGLGGSGISGIPNNTATWTGPGGKYWGNAHWTTISSTNTGPWNASAGHSHGLGRSNQNTGDHNQNHTHTFTIGGSDAAEAHSHGFTQPSAHSFTPSTKSVTQPTFSGTKATLSHLQPYVTVYMYKRTA